MRRKTRHRLEIISGGQTGVDRAALDAALLLGSRHGGWCPRGRKDEDGRIPSKYALKETPSEEYTQRTEWNVRDSDGTFVLTRGKVSGGTAFTIQLARQYGKPCLVLRVGSLGKKRIIRRWLKSNDIRVLNIAGPRESQKPGIYRQALKILTAALRIK